MGWRSKVLRPSCRHRPPPHEHERGVTVSSPTRVFVMYLLVLSSALPSSSRSTSADSSSSWDPVDRLSSLTVPELKQACRSLNVRVSGTKSELLERLRDHFIKEAEGMGLPPPSAFSEENKFSARRPRDLDSDEEVNPEVEWGRHISDPILETYAKEKVLDSLPLYERPLRHLVNRTDLDADGRPRGYAMADGSYMAVKRNPKTRDEEVAALKKELKEKVEKFKAENPEYMAMVKEWDALEKRRKEAIGVAYDRYKKEKEAGEVTAGFDGVQEGGRGDMGVGDLSSSSLSSASSLRAQVAPPANSIVAEKVADLDRQMAYAKVVDFGEKLKEVGWPQSRASVSPKEGEPKVEEELEKLMEEEEDVDNEEEESEYIPIDGMFREEIEFQSFDGTKVSAYLVSSRGAQRFWQRKERGVTVVLPDVTGWRNSQMRNVTDRIAFITDQIVLLPDVYRGESYDASIHPDYEQWRAKHPVPRVLGDARSAMAMLETDYNATARALVGFCFGGGRVLEAAASGLIPVDAAVAFCPTRYHVSLVSAKLTSPTLCIFGGKDTIKGATERDAFTMAQIFRRSEQIRSYYIRVFKSRGHAFVHRPSTAEEEEDAEDAMIAATGWLEYHTRKLQAPPKPIRHVEAG